MDKEQTLEKLLSEVSEIAEDVIAAMDDSVGFNDLASVDRFPFKKTVRMFNAGDYDTFKYRVILHIKHRFGRYDLESFNGCKDVVFYTLRRDILGGNHFK